MMTVAGFLMKLSAFCGTARFSQIWLSLAVAELCKQRGHGPASYSVGLLVAAPPRIHMSPHESHMSPHEPT